MSAVFLKVLNMSITASWLILAVVLTRQILKKAPKWIPCLLWGLVAIRLICPFSFESVLSLIPSTETIPANIAQQHEPAIASGITIVNEAVNPVVAGSFTPAPTDSANPLQIVIPVAAIIWIAGIVITLAYALISYLRLKKTVSVCVPVGEKLLACDEVKTPFILGVFRPSIYVPSSMSGKILENVIRHEKAHLQRHDHWWKPLGFLLLSVYWFNPLCWIAYILFCRDIEMACDEKVIRNMDKDDMAAYSQALLTCSFPGKRIAACPLAFGEVGVKERVKGVLNYKKPAFWIILIAIVACIVLAVCLMTDPFSNKSLSGKLGVSMDRAVAEHNRSSHSEGRFIATDYDVLLVSESGNETTVYAWVLYEEYSFDGRDVKVESGSHIPSAITFDTSVNDNDSSTYDVIEYWEPRDRSYYADDIRAKFPWSIRGKALDITKSKANSEICLRAAREYFGVRQSIEDNAPLKFHLTIGVEGVKSIQITTPSTSGSCQNADGSLYRKGEKIWLEPLAGYSDLRGVSISALDEGGTVIWEASIPNTEDNTGFTRLTQDGWTVANLGVASDADNQSTPEKQYSEETPAERVDNLFDAGDIMLTLNLANVGMCNTYSADDWYSGRFKVLLDCYNWIKLKMPSTEPSEFWLTAVSADGKSSMTFWSNRGAGMVQFSDENTTTFWSAEPANDYSESIAIDIRLEYDNLDVSSSRISFSIEGHAEDAADYFVHYALGEHLMTLSPGNWYGISDYEVIQWNVKETGKNDDSVVGNLNYAFIPWDFNSSGIWAGNTVAGTGQYEGKLICYREFVLQLQEDGCWHCIGLGTGGYELPE